MFIKASQLKADENVKGEMKGKQLLTFLQSIQSKDVVEVTLRTHSSGIVTSTKADFFELEQCNPKEYLIFVGSVGYELVTNDTLFGYKEYSISMKDKIFSARLYTTGGYSNTSASLTIQFK